MLDKRRLVHCGCPCRSNTRLRALIGGDVAGRAAALMRHSEQPANHSTDIQVLPPPIARQRQAAGTRSAPIPPHCWPGPALARLVRASYPTSRALACCFRAFWESAPPGPPPLPSFRFVTFVALLCPLLRLPLPTKLPNCAPVGSFPESYHRRP